MTSTSIDFASVHALLEEGVRAGVFPSAQAHVLVDGRELFSVAVGQAMTTTVFDLASLTKVLCTGALAMKAWGLGKIGPEALVSRVFPDAALAVTNATVGDLLYHRAGLPAWAPYFMPVMRAVPELRAIDCPPQTRLDVRAEVVTSVKKTSPKPEQTAAAVYSDVGFIVLGELLAEVFGDTLDVLFTSHIAKPLELSARFHRLSTWSDAWQQAAPTGLRRPREPAPGQEGGWESLGWVDARPGEVDDDNAWVMDGVAGHAGLFGTARDVARFGQAVLEELEGAARFAPALLWERALRPDMQTASSTRAMAFDTPSAGSVESGGVSSAGVLIASSSPPAVGHLGFTGTSLWIDRSRKLVIALCTNRTALGRSNQQIRAFRPAFHDAVVRAVENDTPRQ